MCQAPSLVPGGTEINGTVSLFLSCDKFRKRIFRKLGGKKKTAEKSMLKKHPSALELVLSQVSLLISKKEMLLSDSYIVCNPSKFHMHFKTLLLS